MPLPGRKRSRARAIALVACLTACASQPSCTRQYVVSDTGPQAYYQTAFPIRDTSRQLERVIDSIRRIGVLGMYTTYRFAREDSITDADLALSHTLARARERYSSELPKAGTGTIIDVQPDGVTLITNNHVTSLPDTVVVYYPADVADAPRAVESISILAQRRDAVHGLPDSRSFRVIARDSIADLALIHVRVRTVDLVPPIRELTVPMGDASKLSWGSFVYVAGFPRGQRMVTRGIVSEPRRGPEDGFVLDGMFNRGISGGVILAVRGDTGELEWVGLATSAAAESDDRLSPGLREIPQENLLVPYDGPLYVRRTPRILYGITYPVTITTIRRFLGRPPS